MKYSIKHRTIFVICTLLSVLIISSYNSSAADKRTDRIFAAANHLLWGTYYGGNDIESPGDIAVDNNGNIYFCGVSSSGNNIASNGTHQTSIRGFSDIFLVKFNSNGQRQWATYFGGSRGENNPHIAIDGNNNILIAGSTKSTDYIASSGSYDDNKLNNEECTFLAKFNSNGQLIYGTYFVSEQESKVTGIDIDNSGNIYLSGICYSNPAFATSGAFLTEENHSYIAQFNASGGLNWSTYYGGTEGITVINDISVQNGLLAVVGFSDSPDLSTTNSHQETLGGNYDGFLTLFSSNGTRSWSTYYGGSARESINSVTFNSSNEIGICGSTKSIIGIASDDAYKSSKVGSEDGFVAKFNLFGARAWGTFFGGLEVYNDISFGINTDSENNFVVLGINSSDDIGTHGTYQPFRAGRNDLYLTKFTGSGQFLWCSYYGGIQDEGIVNEFINLGSSIAIDGLDNIIVVSQTYSSNGISSLNSHQEELSAEGPDLCVAKFAPYPSRLITSPISGTFCAGDSIIIGYTAFQEFESNNTFSIQLSNEDGSFAVPILLGSFSGTVSNSHKVQIPHETQYGDKYRIRVISSNPASTGIDNGSDITIYPLPKAEIVGDTVYCSNDVVEFSSAHTLNSNILWSSVNCNIIGPNDEENVIVEFPKTGKAFLKLLLTNENNCADSSIITINIHPSPSADFVLPESLCARRTVKVRAFTEGDIEILWEIENGILDRTDTNDVFARWDTPGNYSLSLIIKDSTTNCSDTITKTINILEAPAADIIGADTVCQESIEDYSAEIDDNVDYLWVAKGGDITGSVTDPDISVSWGNNSGSLKLILTNKISGCKDSIELIIVILPSPEPRIYGEENVCSDIEYIYYLNKRPGFLNKWSIENGIIIGDQDADSVIVVWNKNTQGKLYLEQINESGKCRADTELLINISEGTKAVFLAEDSYCINSKVSFYAETKPNTSYKWSVQNGTILSSESEDSVEVLWDSDGTASIKLVVTNENNCRDSLEYIINILSLPQTEIDGNMEVCQNSYETYANDFNGEIIWEVEGGEIVGDNNNQNLNILWTTVGNAKINLIRTNEIDCKDTTGYAVIVNPLPVIDMQYNTKSCQGCTEIYSELNDGINYWYIINGIIIDSSSNSNITVEWNNGSDDIMVGLIKLIKVSEHGCSDSIVYEIELFPEQKFIRGKDNLCSGDIIEYRINENPNQTYSWSVLGGILLTDNNAGSILVEWTDVGTGRIELIIFNQTESTSDTLKLDVQINRTPEAVISGFANVNRFSTSNFSTINDGTEIEWKVEGGTITSPQNEINCTVDWGSPGQGKLVLIKSNLFCSDTAELAINIIDSDANAILSVNTYTASPGELIEIPIILNNSVGITEEGITGFETVLSLNSTLLVPVGNTPKGEIKDGILHIRSIIPSTPIDQDILVKFRFMATLGNSQSTVLNLIDSKPVGGIAVVNDLDGRFVLTDLCEDGGIRLVLNTDILSLQQSFPNPARDKVTIIFNIIESGYTTLKIFDNLGELKLIPVNDYLSKGQYEFNIDIRSLANGVYNYTLTTPSQVLTKFMQIIK